MTETNSALALTWDQALAWRLGQQLLDSPGTDPVRVISKIGGVQAQVASSAAQAVAIRSKRLADIEHLLWEKRRLVKTWAMRGTLHLLPASEIGVWIAALRQRPWKITPAWEKYHGIEKSQLDSLTGAIPEVMSGEPMTREELTAAVVAKTRDRGLGEALSSGWSQVLKPAANQGSARPGTASWAQCHLRRSRRLDGCARSRSRVAEEAMRVVVERFLDANGPATISDFARWFGVDPKTGRELMTPVVENLVPVDIEGYQALLTKAGAKAAANTKPAESAHLLPGFDPYTLAPLSHREHIIPKGKVDEVSKAAGWIAPVILDNGRIVGTWETEDGSIALQPFGKLPKKTISALKDHVEQRYHGLLGKSIAVTVP